MNIVDVARKLKPLQRAISIEANMIIEMDNDGYRLLEVVDDVQYVELGFNVNLWLIDDWEIEIDWTDFWTAWNAYGSDREIRSEYWGKEDRFGCGNYSTLDEDEINGRWEIIN